MVRNEMQDFEDLLAQLTGATALVRRGPDGVIGVTVDDVRRADHQMSTQSLDRIYQNTVRKVGNQLTYGSVKHHVAGIVSSVVDGVYALSRPVQDFAESPFVKGLAEEFAGRTDTPIGDLVLAVLRQYVPTAALQEVEQTLEGVREVLQRSELRHQTIADYCNEHKTTPEKVLRSPKAMTSVVETVYGSLEAYGQAVLTATMELGDFASKLAVAGLFPVDGLVAGFVEEALETKLGPGAAASLNIDADALGTMVGDYVRDVTLLASTYLLEMAEENGRDLGRYEKVVARRK